jgi:hypothetical protein
MWLDFSIHGCFFLARGVCLGALGSLLGAPGRRFLDVSGDWSERQYLWKMYQNRSKTKLFEGFTVRATALSADFGISFSTVGCWAACGRLWAAIERHYVAKRCHMMLFGVIYTSRPLTGALDKSGLTPLTIVNGAKFQGLREILQKRAKTGGKLQYGATGL